MNISWMHERIFVIENKTETDEIGNHRNVRKDFYTCYATVSAESPKEESAAGMIVDDTRLDFTIRWCKKAMEITSTGYQVVFRDELYDIEGIDHMTFNRKSIKLHCRKVRR